MSFFNEEIILTNFLQKSKDTLCIALAFPNTYMIGMASLGFQSAWKLFNENPNVKVTRWFTDIQEKTKSPPDYVGFSFSWELDYKNIFAILEKNNIPLHVKDRSENAPIVFCGGQVPNANPEPFANNFDFFLTGDLEVLAKDLTNKIIEIKNLKREEKLNKLIYAIGRGAINRASTNGNLTYSSILTPNCIWPNTFIVEVVRGCPELCKFCLASYGSLPFRTPSVKKNLIPIVDSGLKHTNKIGLLGASVTQHPEFEELIEYLLQRTTPLQIQIASVRADTISKFLAKGLFKLGAKSITMAIETGSEKLRKFINKKVTNEIVKNSIQTIYDTGFNSIKLYGMVGLPTETKGDLKETVDFLKEIKLKNKTKKLIWGCSVFIPKAKTPFYRYGIDKNSDKKIKYYSKELHQIGVDFRPESYRWSLIQALISRGDKSIGKILELAYRYGSTLGSFKRAIKECASEVDTDYFIFKDWKS